MVVLVSAVSVPTPSTWRKRSVADDECQLGLFLLSGKCTEYRLGRGHAAEVDQSQLHRQSAIDYGADYDKSLCGIMITGERSITVPEGPEYLVLDVKLEDGCTLLFWHHKLVW